MHCLEAHSSVPNVISAEVRPGSLWARAAMNWSLLTADFNNSSLIATECRSKMDWERSHAAQLKRWSLSGMVNSYMLDRHMSYLEGSGCCVCTASWDGQVNAVGLTGKTWVRLLVPWVLYIHGGLWDWEFLFLYYYFIEFSIVFYIFIFDHFYLVSFFLNL